MDSIFKKNPEKKGILLTVAAVIPLILCLVFTWIDAQQVVRRQQSEMATMLLHQAESISDRAWDMVGFLSELSGRSCDDINIQLQKYASQYPYFRSIGVMNEGTVTCTSVYGSSQGNLDTLLQRSPPEPREALWMLSTAGTSSVKDRAAILYMQDMPNSSSNFAVVDGQYLLDFMTAAGKSHGYHISMQFGGGYRIESGSASKNNPAPLQATSLRASSSRFPISVKVTSPAGDLAKTWCQGVITFMPMAVIFSLLLMTVTSNWLRRKVSIHDRLRRAIQRREFSVNFQPIYHIPSATCRGAEALLRWQLPNGDWAAPDIFITAAEQEGMIVPLTQHLLELIAEEARDWTLKPGFNLGLNIAGKHIQHPDFIADIHQFAARLAHLQLNITLELTERSLISDGDEVIEKLASLRREGVKIAVDDFGTGHCSLSYLQTFPLDHLKIDRGFVNAIESVEGEVPVLDAIIMLSHKLKLSIVAEGVEAPVQLNYLKKQGVTLIQGYLYAKPMTGQALMRWLETNGQRTLTPETNGREDD